MSAGLSSTGRPIPPELAHQLEDDLILGSCDWGSCSNEQVGWALCSCADCLLNQEGWFAICQECIDQGDTKDEGWSHPVVEVITFEDVRASWMDAY